MPNTKKKGSPKKDHLKKKFPPEKQFKENRYYDLLGLAIIILLGIIIYSNTFNCSFHFDDSHTILNNTTIRNLSDVKAWWNFSPNRPVSIFTFALNYHFNQFDVRYWHLVNLVIHLINACLVWWMTLLIFSSPVLKDQTVTRHKKNLAFLTALLFVSHPLATQSVTYIIQRMNSLVALFYLLSLALYVKARLTNKGNISKTLLFSGSLISAVLAMLTKENAFTLPLAIVLFELFFLRTKKFSLNFKDYRMILLMAILLGGMLIIPLKYSFDVFKPLPPTMWHSYTLTPSNYLLTQFSVIVKYIQLLFLPINQNLEYDFPISNNFFEVRTLLSFLLLLSLIILAIFLFKRNRVISFGIFWFFLTLSVESGIIPINDVIYEHRTYLPSFGFFLIISSGFYLLLWDKYKFPAIAILAIIIGSNSFMTHERNKVWKDELTLWNDNVAKTPDIARPFNNRGIIYFNLRQWEKAISDYSRAIEINPGCSSSCFNRGIVYGILRQWDKAIADDSRTIELDPKSDKAYYNRGVAYGNLGKPEKAISDFSKTIELDPKYAQAYYNRGVAYEKLGQWDKAVDDYSKAIELNPNLTQAYYSRAYAYTKLGKVKK